MLEKLLLFYQCPGEKNQHVAVGRLAGTETKQGRMLVLRTCSDWLRACAPSCFSRVRLCGTLRTTDHPAPLSMGFSRQQYWSGLPHPPPGHLPNPGIEPRSPALQMDSLQSEPPGKPKNTEEGSLSILQGESWLGLEIVNLSRPGSGHHKPRLLNVHTNAIHCTGMESRAGSALHLPSPWSYSSRGHKL